jgi:hypothetical protein
MTVSSENRALFEKLGIATVRLDIPMGQFIETVGQQREALEWLAEQEARARRIESVRFWGCFF